MQNCRQRIEILPVESRNLEPTRWWTMWAEHIFLHPYRNYQSEANKCYGGKKVVAAFMCQAPNILPKCSHGKDDIGRQECYRGKEASSRVLLMSRLMRKCRPSKTQSMTSLVGLDHNTMQCCSQFIRRVRYEVGR